MHPFLAAVRRRASARRTRIVFAESWDGRVLQAATALARARVLEPVLLLAADRPQSHAAAAASGLETVAPLDAAAADELAGHLLARGEQRGLTSEQAARLARHPLYAADDLVRRGVVAGCVAGCVYSTADVLRAALRVIGPAHGCETVSSAFYMALDQTRAAAAVLTFADCAVIPEPSAEQLADIALSAAHDRVRIVGDEPVVAFLSFSTHGSATSASVERVRRAVAITRGREPALRLDGELQVDAALVREVAERKAPASSAAGSANVLVFPSLDAGNIGYKLTERLAQAEAIGPIVQGLALPCSDLSRGASPDDIMHVAAITALQSHAIDN
ncbi:MAG: phosphate acetyltransferase [Gemmatimonadaceae bacterium]